MSVKLTLKERIEIREKNIKRNKEILNIMTQVTEAQSKEEVQTIQGDICTTIMNNIKQNTSIKLEQEETLEDGSIVITISV